MYIIKEGDIVRYEGDSSSMEERRRQPSFAIVNKIDTEKEPNIGIQLIPNNELLGVHYNLVRSIYVKKEHLLRLGFEEKLINNSNYYINKTLIVTKVVIYPKVNSTYFAGFRIIPKAPFKLKIEPYLTKEKEVDSDKLEVDFPQIATVNSLIKHCKSRGLFSQLSIDEIYNTLIKNENLFL